MTQAEQLSVIIERLDKVEDLLIGAFVAILLIVILLGLLELKS